MNQGWERLFWEAFERSSLPMTLLDEERRRVAANDAYCRLVQRSREEVVGKRLEELAEPAGGDVEEAWRRFLEEGEWLGEFDLHRADGTTVRMQFAGVLAKLDGERRALFACIECDSLPELADEDHERHQGARTERVLDPDPSTLTPRELEIVKLVAEGLTSPEIAERLVLSPTTVRTHVRNAMGKLGASTRAHLVAMVLTQEALLNGPSG